MMKKLLASLALVAAVLAAPVVHADRYWRDRPEVRVRVAPPAVREEVRPPAPSPRHFWHGGHWYWERGRHVWIPGSWELGRPGYHWAEGHWVNEGGYWVFRPGHWVR